MQLKEEPPTADEVADAYGELATHDIPGLPSLDAVRTLRAVSGPPWNVYNRRVEVVGITDGEPMHGEKRSDDHISAYEVLVDRECPTCGGQRAVYRYSCHHNIAGSEVFECRQCGHEYYSESWG